MQKQFFWAILLQLIIYSAGAATVDTISVYSKSMRKEVKVVVIKPAAYNSNNGKHFPVVYLLHGYSGNYARWINEAPQLSRQADALNMLLVCPDGGYNSWYFDSRMDSTVRYETFMTAELVPFIDASYSTIAKKEYRAITGLSMGGHGALYLGARHKDLYGAAGSICGGVDIRPFPDNWDMKKVLGEQTTNQANWDTHTVINVIDSLNNGELKLVIDCGIGDFFLAVNRNLHQKLMDKKIDHDYTERPGAHNKAYWANSIDYHLLFFAKYFDAMK